LYGTEYVSVEEPEPELHDFGGTAEPQCFNPNCLFVLNILA
jgi:hypothetical protein